MICSAKNVCAAFSCAFLLMVFTGLAKAQDAVTLSVKNQPLQTVITELNRQTGYEFVINDNDVNLGKRVSLSVKNAALGDVLSRLFASEGLSYSIIDNKVVLARKAESDAGDASHQRAKKDENLISGRVVDSAGEPIIAAGVIEKGTGNGVITDLDGKFQIKISGSEAVLEIQSLGYETRNVTVKPGRSLVVTLQEERNDLEEAVVVGYGTIRKRDLTGSVS